MFRPCAELTRAYYAEHSISVFGQIFRSLYYHVRPVKSGQVESQKS